MSVDGGELERTLGFLEAMTLGGGTMIGAGIFILPGIAARNAGPASSVSYAIAGFVALLAALSLSELATGMPIAGGSYHYVNRALGSLAGSVVGWGMWSGLMFASAFYMVGFGQYIVEPVPFLDGRGFIILLGLAGLALLTGVNYYGTEESSSLQNVMIGSETAVIVVFVVVGVFFIQPGNLEPFAPAGAGGVVATTGIVFISFLGFEIIATVAGEIKNPGRIIPLSMILSVVLVTILYVLVMLVSTGVIPYDRLGDSPIPVADVATAYLGPAGAVAIVFAAIVAAISSSNSSILAASRVVYAMGRDGVVSKWLNVSHPRFFTPHRAIVTTSALTAALILVGLRVDAIVSLLAEAASFSFLVAYALVHVSLVVFRRADPDEYDPSFSLPSPLYPVVPVLGVLLSIVVVTQMAPVIVAIGTGIIVVGVVWYAVYARGRVVSEGLLRDALWGPPAAAYRVVVPVANPETQRGLLRLAAASARANADVADPELVAVNVVHVEHESPLQNVEAERADHQRDLLENAQAFADEMGVTLRTRALTAADTGEALLSVLEEEAADEVLLGWSGETTGGDAVTGPTVATILENAPCDVALVTLRGAVGTPVGLVAPGRDAASVARRVAEFATVEDVVPTLLAVVPAEGDESAARQRGADLVAEAAAAAGLEPDEYTTEVVVDDDVGAGIQAVIGEYQTVCVSHAEAATDSGAPVRSALASAATNVALVRSAEQPVPRGSD
ncbi:amino acid permease [Halomicroarcula sp. GCM10025817]|uniref:amino acid permease n=1 Tax=Haloarcula TaxID=2237 RepID=UPI0023E7AF1C|nr:amino acid permease [Halomicroarcula sp. SYNS111]